MSYVVVSVTTIRVINGVPQPPTLEYYQVPIVQLLGELGNVATRETFNQLMQPGQRLYNFITKFPKTNSEAPAIMEDDITPEGLEKLKKLGILVIRGRRGRCYCGNRNPNDCECETRYVIYKIKCKRCKKYYIGKTQESFRTRMNRHFRSLRKRDGKSAISLHKCSSRYSEDSEFETSIVEIIEQRGSKELMKSSLSAAEARNIEAIPEGSSLNRRDETQASYDAMLRDGLQFLVEEYRNDPEYFVLHEDNDEKSDEFSDYAVVDRLYEQMLATRREQREQNNQAPPCNLL